VEQAGEIKWIFVHFNVIKTLMALEEGPNIQKIITPEPLRIFHQLKAHIKPH
jgi:hypothetical protein